ncbi:MAG TPA: hypothetical protein VH144_01045 [Candidatus Saccharimonadales bacterium]|jgi:hypothetical protein|nr:hypothetical protein [Candidatus Saccharimonadales bacterium]
MDPNNPLGPEELDELEHGTGERVGDGIRDYAHDKIQEGKDRAKDELKDRGKEAIKNKFGSGAKQGVEQGAKGLGNAASEGVGAAGAGAAGEGAGAAAGAAGAGAAGAAGSGAAGAGAAGAAGAGAAAGTGAAAAGTGAAAAGAGAAVGAGAAGAGAGAAGAAAGATAGAAAGTAIPVPVVGTAAGVVIGAASAALANKKVRRNLYIAIPLSILVLFVGGVFVLYSFLNIFKPVFTIGDFTNKLYAPLQAMVNSRAEEVFGGYIVNASAGAVAWQADTSDVATNGGHVAAAKVDASSKLGQLYAAMNKDGMQGRITSKYGLTFKKGTHPGAVAIVLNGKTIGEATSISQALAIIRKSSFGEQGLASIINNELNAWNYTKRVTLAENQKTTYQTNQLSVPGAKDANDDASVTQVLKTTLTTLNQPAVSGISDVITCFIQGCGGNSKGVGGTSSGDAVSTAATDSFNASLAALNPKTQYVVDPIRVGAEKNLQKESLANTTSLVAWLDTAAGIRNAAVNNDPASSQKVVDLRKTQAGRIWSFWQTAADQYLANDLSQKSAEQFFSYFNDSESSKAFCIVDTGNTDCGTGFADFQKINEINKTAISTVWQDWRDSQKSIAGFVLDKLLAFWSTFRNVPPVKQIVDLAAKQPVLVSFAVPAIPIGFHLIQGNLNDFMGQIYGLGGNTVLPVCDGADRDVTFLNCGFAGGQEAAKTMCQEHFGCVLTTPAQDTGLRVAQQQMQRDQIASMPWTDRFFALKNPNSLLYAAIAKSPIPYSAGQNISSGISAILSLPLKGMASIGGLVTQSTHAATGDLTQVNGVPSAGIPVPVLASTPLSQELQTDGGTCADKPVDQTNVCKTDDSLTDGLMAHYTHHLPGDDAGTDVAGSGPVSGDTKSLATQLLNSPNVGFQLSFEKTAMEHIAATGRATQCGAPAVDPKLLGALVKISQSYKIIIGVLVDGHQCDGLQHPKGKAADLNGVATLDGSQSTGHTLSWDTALDLVRRFYGDMGRALPSNSGGMGQKQCTSGLPHISGITYFSDACTHLHVDVR